MEAGGAFVIQLGRDAVGRVRVAGEHEFRVQLGGGIHHVHGRVEAVRDLDEVVSARTAALLVEGRALEGHLRRLLAEKDAGIIDPRVQQRCRGSQVGPCLRPEVHRHLAGVHHFVPFFHAAPIVLWITCSPGLVDPQRPPHRGAQERRGVAHRLFQ